MKKAKAVELLKLAVPIKALTQQEYADFVEAVNMGMDALEQPTSPDTIDRKAALDALRKCQTYLYDARDPELKIELSSAEAAINNLSTIQPEKAQLSQEDATKDTISRQQAIDATNDWYEGLICGSINGLIKRLNALPTIQPEKAQHSQEGTTSDMISRTETVEHLRRVLGATVPNTDYDEGFIDGAQFAISTVSTMPSAQPEPKEGQWVNGCCNKCGGHAPFWAMASTYYKSDFCPHCGAKMKGAEHETN